MDEESLSNATPEAAQVQNPLKRNHGETVDVSAATGVSSSPPAKKAHLDEDVTQKPTFQSTSTPAPAAAEMDEEEMAMQMMNEGIDPLAAAAGPSKQQDQTKSESADPSKQDLRPQRKGKGKGRENYKGRDTGYVGDGTVMERPKGEDGEEAEKEVKYPKRKVALFVGYSGTGYSGMQFQTRPDTGTWTEITIEGLIFEALTKLSLISSANSTDPKKIDLQRAARTDKGVSAAGNVVSMKMITEFPGLEDKDTLVREVNKLLPDDVKLWGYVRTLSGFNARTACDTRVYEYLFPSYMLLPPRPGCKLDQEIKEFAATHAAASGSEVKPQSEEVHPFWAAIEAESAAEPGAEDETTKETKPVVKTSFVPLPSASIRAIDALHWPDLKTFPLGTRASKLALIQAHGVSADFGALQSSSGITFPVVPMSVAGDRNKTTPLYLLTSSGSSAVPAKSLWTEELEQALLDGKLDGIVHCAKDMPTNLPEGCELGVLLTRPDPNDALVVKQGLEYKTLKDLPDGSVVGTSSVRRIAQLKRHYPKLEVQDIRGNLETRFRKLDDPAGPFSAIILAAAGMQRFGAGDRISSLLTAPEMYYAVAQAALAIEIRKGDKRAYEILKGVGCWKTEWRVGAERGLLNELEGGCSVPVGVDTVLEEIAADDVAGSTIPRAFGSEPEAPTEDSPLLHHSGTGKVASFHIRTCITSVDGTQQVCYDAGVVQLRSYAEAEAWGHVVAKELLKRGGDVILKEINELRQQREEQDKAKAASIDVDMDAKTSPPEATPAAKEVEGSSGGAGPTTATQQPKPKSKNQTYLHQKRQWRVGQEELNRFKEMCAMFVGSHNFHNFTLFKPFNDKTVKRFILSIDVAEPQVYSGMEWVSVKIHGQSFMLHQIRKMMALAMMAARTKTPTSVIPAMFGRPEIHIPKAPALGLLLENPRFGSFNKKAAKLAQQNKQAQGADPISFEPYREQIEAFKVKNIYEKMREEEDKAAIYHTWVSTIDTRGGDALSYLNPLGIIPEKAMKPTKPKGQPRAKTEAKEAVSTTGAVAGAEEGDEGVESDDEGEGGRVKADDEE